MSEGALMNIGLINWKVLPTSSQTVRKMATLGVPRIFFS